MLRASGEALCSSATLLRRYVVALGRCREVLRRSDASLGWSVGLVQPSGATQRQNGWTMGAGASTFC
jgi:hypothetical protein